MSISIGRLSRFKLTIRRKLFIVSSSLIIIPLFGYQYIQEMEAFLRKDQERSLLETTRIVAAILQDQKKLFATESDDSQAQGHLFVRPLLAAIQVDGYTRDWEIYKNRIQHYSLIQSNEKPFKLAFSIGNYQRYLYTLFQVTDDIVIHRKPNEQGIGDYDHLQIIMENQAGKTRRYVIAPHSPGRVYGQLVVKERRILHLGDIDQRIQAAWQDTNSGYNIELRMPISMLGKKLAFRIADVDNLQKPKIEYMLSTAGTKVIDALGTVVVPSSDVEQLLRRMERASSRIWVIDKTARVVALTGTLSNKDADEEFTNPESDEEIGIGDLLTGIVRLLYGLILKQPATEFQDVLSNVSHLKGQEIDTALGGRPSTQWRLTPDARINILTATHPVRIDGDIVGAVAIEETSNSILLLQNRTLEILINLSILAFAVTTVVLLAFATRLSTRIRKLRDDAENAIGEDGRVVGTIRSSYSTDEIGDLARSYSAMLDRLRQYNSYLETMASKLSHELRTPITVVRSSLENLETSKLTKEDKTYTKRAREGVERLSRILTRMSEATRIEHTLQQEKPVVFNIVDVVSGCVDGYQIAKPKHRVELDLSGVEDQETLKVRGVPDLIAQLMDKLVANAQDFAKADTPISIRIQSTETHVILLVINEGPPLPEKMHKNLFDSMVSVRDKKGDEPHLGLGLYIVRLIVEFHKGQVRANSREDTPGAEFRVTIPLLKE